VKKKLEQWSTEQWQKFDTCWCFNRSDTNGHSRYQTL